METGILAALKDPALVWFIIGFTCFMLEFLLPGVVIAFFGAGAWIVAGLILVIRIPLVAQLFVFIITSVAFLVLLRSRFIGKDKDGPDVTDDFIGKQTLVTKAVVKGQFGQVRFKGALWKAETVSDAVMEPGQYVRIVGQESITLRVEPI